MEVVVILRVLWRFRVLVAVAAVLAVLAGAAMVYKLPSLESRQYDVGIGSASALVDTPSSQTVDLSDETGASITTLSSRATLLASVMTSSPIKDEIARRVGIDPDTLLTAGAGGALAAPPGRNDIMLSASVPTVESGEVPIIVVKTQAPTTEVARRLADAAFDQLQESLTSTAGIDKVPDARRLVVRRLGDANAKTLRQGPGTTTGVAVGFVLFLLGCAMILGTWALVRGWKRAAAMDRESEADDDDEGPWDYTEDAAVVAFEDRSRAASGS